LCCDGSLFADVELAGGDEAASLEILGLEVEDSDGDARGLLVQPCRALKGTRCGIYPHRPDCCRTFECRLLRQVRGGAVSVGRAQERIAEARRRIADVRRRVASLGAGGARLPLKERCAEVLASSGGGGGATGRRREELEAAMSATEQYLKETFLDE
jgi:hypothetical protein